MIRVAAFQFLADQTLVHGTALPRSVLAAGFEFRGTRVPLVGPQGIFKPRVIPTGIPLSITTVPEVPGRERPYADEIGPDGFLRYRYRGTDPQHHENAGLRQAMFERVELVYFHGLEPGFYHPIWPVLVVRDDPEALAFSVAFFGSQALPDDLIDLEADDIERAYVTRMAVHRLHQAAFRQRVLRAYTKSCAVCRLRHSELLDAAHIVADASEGRAAVSNGLALCKLHHAAFDRNIIGMTPSLLVQVNARILEEVDGPMLDHGLKEFHGHGLLVVPARRAERPNREYLEERFERFREAS